MFTTNSSKQMINSPHTRIKRIGVLLWSYLLLVGPLAAQEFDRPAIKSYATSFAIIVDDSTYHVAKQELVRYKQTIEAKGIGTYIIHNPWKQPEDIRDILQELYQDDRLEGAVLVGNIPVPMIRDAQHLTSTFKMDQRINWQRSSVASDRFYDDFDLRFDFLKQDSLKTDLFYYSLSPESPQYISMDIYSARIKPPQGSDFHQKIKQFLDKAIQSAASTEKLDEMFLYTGHGYHSESLNAWAGEQLALREHFPQLFNPGARIDFQNFRMEEIMRFPYLNAIQRPGLDLAIFHGHGSTDAQLLNGYPYASAPHPSIENIKRYLRSKIQGVADKDGDIQAAKQRYHDWLGVPLAWMDDALIDSVVQADSLFNAQTDLYSRDLEASSPQAKLMVLDACDNGAFYLDDYLAAHYSFGNGATIATVANSVGVLQDVWPDALMGTLSYGMRVGNWFKQRAYLETHLFGDPTYSFASLQDEDINTPTRFPAKHLSFWKKQLNSEVADIQSLALLQLVRSKQKGMSSILLDKFRNSPLMTVRLQALLLLSEYNNNDYEEALLRALKDPYELTRRLAVYLIGEKGNDQYINPLVDAYLHDRHSERVWSRINNVLPFMQLDLVEKELERQLSSLPYLTDAQQSRQRLTSLVARGRERIEKDYASMNSTDLSVKEKMANLRVLRAYRYHEAIPHVLQLVLHPKEEESVRILGLEVLSWYNKSYRKADITAACQQILQQENSEQIKKQARKTLAILN